MLILSCAGAHFRFPIYKQNTKFYKRSFKYNPYGPMQNHFPLWGRAILVFELTQKNKHFVMGHPRNVTVKFTFNNIKRVKIYETLANQTA